MRESLRISEILLGLHMIDSYEKICQDIDMLIVASSSSLFTESVARVALESNIDYLDILYSRENIALRLL